MTEKCFEEWCQKCANVWLKIFRKTLYSFRNVFFLYLWYLNTNLPWRQITGIHKIAANFDSSHVSSETNIQRLMRKLWLFKSSNDFGGKQHYCRTYWFITSILIYFFNLVVQCILLWKMFSLWNKCIDSFAPEIIIPFNLK